MEINITDSEIKEMTKEQIKLFIKNKVFNVLNEAGNANYFRMQTIQSLTYQAVYDMINKDYIADALKNLNKEDIISRLSSDISTSIVEYITQ